MDVVSECPLTVGSVLWQPNAEEWALTIVAKATFLLAPGASIFVPDAHASVYAHDAFHDDDPGKSLAVASDLIPFKQRPEVLVVGHAHAPVGKPVASLLARLAIGTVDKAIEVRGDQFFALDGALSEPLKLQRMPLRWERAAGGPATSNPVGVRTGDAAGADLLGRFQLPNLLPPGCGPSSLREVIAPIGFGPLAPAWPTRAARLPSHGRAARIAQWNASPLSEDFNAAYFNAAPPDQQLSLLDGSPTLRLENLHARHSMLTTSLAGPQPRATVDWGHGPPAEVLIAPDTLHIDTDRGIATLTYRGHLLLDYPTRTGRVHVRTARPPARRAITLTNVAQPLPEPPAAEARLAAADTTGAPFRIDAPVSTLDPLARSGAVALPFRPIETAHSASSPPAHVAPPLQAALPPPLPPPRMPPQIAPPEQIAPPPQIAPPAHVTPLPQVAPPPLALPAHSTPPPAHVTPPPQVAPPLTSFTGAQALHIARAPSSPALADRPFVPPPTSSSDAPEPPPLIGPLASRDLASDDAARPSASLATPLETPMETEDPVPAQPGEPAPLPLATHPLERCARIAASLARNEDDEAHILEKHQLDRPMWLRLDEHWAHAMRFEAERQNNKLLKAYDAAYVAQLEEERGPIAVDEYASILVAAERGGIEALMRALSLPLVAMMRIRRVWIVRSANDAGLGARIRRAVELERGK